jgi:hypothetical protein
MRQALRNQYEAAGAECVLVLADVAGQPPRLAHLDHLNPGTHPPNPRYLHLLPLSLLLHAARQPLPGRPAS